jgi:molecular chaperone HscA
MMSTSGILCIDFGTSSIRAAIVKDGRLKPEVLELGEAFRSSIDRASIPSAVFIEADKTKILFGEAALNKGQRGSKSMLFEMSPKKWMTSEPPEFLDKVLIPGGGLTHKHLLAGLLAQSFSAISTASGIPKSELIKLETRVSHPVWAPEAQFVLKKQLTWITEAARQISGLTDQAIAPEKLYTALSKVTIKTTQNGLDVEEPVAAALELFDNSDNAREICVVVDVGAGTTDLGIFLSLTPDPSSRYHSRKFIQAASPRSMYMAGDLIDQEVIGLISKKASNLSKDNLQDLQRRRRSIKETIFSRTKKVYEANLEVSLSDLEKQPNIKKMKDELTKNFNSLISEATSFIKIFAEASFHRAERINVVFAGGGSNISFLHEAIGKSTTLPNGTIIPIVIRSANSTDRTLPAAYERLAVAMGGTTPLEFWPNTTILDLKQLRTEWDREFNTKKEDSEFNPYS